MPKGKPNKADTIAIGFVITAYAEKEFAQQI